MFFKNKNFLLFIPALFLNILFILSFYLMFQKTIGANENIFLELISTKEFLKSLFYGLEVSLLVIVFSVVLFLLIYYMLFLLSFKYKQDLKAWFLFTTFPVLIPYSFCAFLMFLMFFPVGYLKEFMPFLVGSTLSLVIAYAYKVVPFLILVSFPNLLKISKNEIKLHKIYSSKSFDFFWYILMRRNLKVIFIALFIVFSFVFNAYEIPSILGSNIDKMPAVYVNETLHTYSLNSINQAYASSMLFFGITLFFIPLFYLSYNTTKRRVF